LLKVTSCHHYNDIHSSVWLYSLGLNCREQLELVKAAIRRCAVVACLSKSSGRKPTDSTETIITIASCCISATENTRDVKLAVLLRASPLGQLQQIEKALSRIAPSRSGDDLDAIERQEQLCTFLLVAMSNFMTFERYVEASA
jgi:hypothetical protein